MNIMRISCNKMNAILKILQKQLPILEMTSNSCWL